jgi:hypothetical protein
MGAELPYRPLNMNEEESRRNGEEDEEEEVDETVRHGQHALKMV